MCPISLLILTVTINLFVLIATAGIMYGGKYFFLKKHRLWLTMSLTVSAGSDTVSFPCPSMMFLLFLITKVYVCSPQHLLRIWSSVSPASLAARPRVQLTIASALILHPEVQAKVHAELDSVIGNNRLLTFADQDSLPYLQMVLSESLRWNPVIPLSAFLPPFL